MNSRPTGWFADSDPENGEFHWQPCVQTDSVILSTEIWFKTEGECVAFIAEELLGLGMLDEVAHQHNDGIMK
jgi:hypothetical protein